MALTPRLDLRQTQLLVMTPQLQQAIKLLQFSSMELSEYVDTQLESNPLLEREEAGGDSGAAESPEIDKDADTHESGEPVSLDAAVSAEGLGMGSDELDFEVYDNIYDEGAAGETGGFRSDSLGTLPGSSRGGSFDDREANPEEMVSSQTSLKDHLTGQLLVQIRDPIDRLIGVHLIDLLDESGYLTGDFAQVAQVLGCSPERVEATLYLLQTFDPTGVFARSLSECLALQLHERGLLDPTMQVLLDHLPLVGRRDWITLGRVCETSSDQLQKLVGTLRSLNPRPALIFDQVVAQPITPDVIMRPQPAGGWIVELNSDVLPRILVNNHYYAQVSRSIRNREDKQYLNECIQSANWLVKSLHQRATTILKVATEIIRQQQTFFINGVESLKPLVLRDIADAISMHESTVSRVTSNKYVSTPRGIFELKYFFTHAVGGANGGDVHSAESVRHRIRKMIDSETAKTVLSDDALAEALQKDGIDIARRTVAKYREAMRIPSSVQRRREKGDMM